jgi:hypothetical protein
LDLWLCCRNKNPVLHIRPQKLRRLKKDGKMGQCESGMLECFLIVRGNS